MKVTHFETKEGPFLVFCDTNIFSWVMIYYNFKRSLMTFMTFFLHTVVSIKKWISNYSRGQELIHHVWVKTNSGCQNLAGAVFVVGAGEFSNLWCLPGFLFHYSTISQHHKNYHHKLITPLTPKMKRLLIFPKSITFESNVKVMGIKETTIHLRRSRLSNKFSLSLP